MAEGGGDHVTTKGSDEYSSIIDSDEYHAHYCSPCIRDDKQNGAVTFCMDCEEYFCDNCLAAHNRIAKLRAHTLVNQTTLQNQQQTYRTAPVLTEKCDKHHGRLIDTYCSAHDTVCCSVCVSTEHKLCNIVYLPDIATDNHDETERKKGSIKRLTDDLENLQKEKQKDMENIDKEMEEAKIEINTKRKQLAKLLDEMEERTIGQLEARRSSCKRQIEDDMLKLDQMKTKMEKRLSKLESAKDSTEAFVHLKKGQEEEVKGTITLAEIQESSRKEIGFTRNDSIEDLLASYTTLGTVADDRDSPKHDQMYKAIYNKKSSISAKDDPLKVSSIMGCCFLADATFLLADWENKRIKRLNSSYKLTDVLTLPESPSDVCGIGTLVAAVSIQWMKQIQLISLVGTMTKIRSFNISQPCRGIAYHNHQLFLSCGGGTGGGRYTEGPGQIQVFNIAGTHLKTFKMDSNEREIFNTPYNIVVNRITQSIHVSDNKNGLVTLDMDGNKLWTFSDRQLEYTNGVCTDKLGQVFVCGFRSSNVFLVNRQGKKLCTLIAGGGEVAKTKCLAYDGTNSHLLVGMQQNDKVKVFSLTKQQ